MSIKKDSTWIVAAVSDLKFKVPTCVFQVGSSKKKKKGKITGLNFLNMNIFLFFSPLLWQLTEYLWIVDKTTHLRMSSQA